MSEPARPDAPRPETQTAPHERVGTDTDETGSTKPATPASLHSPAQTDHMAPGWLGGYRIVELLGQGGMGAVYSAEDVALKRPVALKTMKVDHAQNADSRVRFTREAQAAAAIESDHIVRIYQVGEDRGVPFIAMELLRGQPLDQWMKDHPVTLPQLLKIGCETALGLADAHAKGLVHRDIKPSNLWLESPKSRIKILDFGIARSASEAGLLTGSGVILGTPAYMAPEQARGLPVDFRCDLFSLGCVLYHLATGRRPFTGSDTMAILTSLALDTPAAPQELNPEIPAALSNLIVRLLSKKPEDRPASAEEVAEALSQIQASAGSSASTVVLEVEPERKDWLKESRWHKWQHKRQLFIIVGGLVACCIVGIVCLSSGYLHGLLERRLDSNAPNETSPEDKDLKLIAREETDVGLPDLVYTHARPQEGDLSYQPRAAFVGPNDINPGAVAVVISYAPSMYEKPKDGGKSRIERTWVELEKILKELPDGTQLTVRGFGIAPEANQQVQAEPFESATTRGGLDKDDNTHTNYPGTYDRQVQAPLTVDWELNPLRLKSLMSTLKNAPLVEGKDRDRTNSPMVRSVLHAVREDFKGTKEYQSRDLIVISDGADNSCWDYSNQQNPKLNFDPLMKSLDREFRGLGRGIAVRMLLINDDTDTTYEQVLTKLFETRVRVVLKELEPPGSVLVGDLKAPEKQLTELNQQLKPRVRLNRTGTVLPENLRAGVPLRFDNRKPRPEPPEWTGMPSPGEYEAWVGQKPSEDQRQTLAFDAADSMIVRLSRPEAIAGKRNRVQFERVVWGREGEFGRALRLSNRQQERTEQNWLLSAVMHRTSIHGYRGEQTDSMGRYIFDLRAAVENVDPVRLKPVDGQVLKQVAPDFVWWELTSTTELNKRAPVYIWREYGHPAPVWRMRRWDWADKGNEPPKATLRGWLPQQLKLPAPRQTTTLAEVTSGSSSGRQPDGGTWIETWAGELDDGQKWTAKFSWEQHAFATNPDSREPDKLKLALVVRVYLDDPKKAPKLNGKPAPLFVQVADARIEEHRFFRNAGAYTGYFHFGPSTVADPAANKEVKLFAAIDLLKPGVGVPFELPLPKPDVQGEDPVWKIWEEATSKQSK